MNRILAVTALVAVLTTGASANPAPRPVATPPAPTTTVAVDTRSIKDFLGGRPR